MPLAVGSLAPDFTLKAPAEGGFADVRLSANFGVRPTVLFFFPAAFSGTCTDELCAVSESLPSFGDAAVYGISVDSGYALAAWSKQNGIGVTLLSDYRREVTRAYEVELPDLGGMGPSAARAAFVIDKDGVIRYAEQTPTPKELPDFEAVRAAVAATG